MMSQYLVQNNRNNFLCWRYAVCCPAAQQTTTTTTVHV